MKRGSPIQKQVGKERSETYHCRCLVVWLHHPNQQPPNRGVRSIEICCSYRNRRKSSGIIYMRCKRTTAIPQEDGNRIVGLIGNGDIHFAIIVEITGDKGAWSS